MKLQKKIYVSDALSRLYIKMQEDVPDVIVLNFLQNLHIGHIYYIYECLACVLYKPTAKQQSQRITKS